MWVEAVFRSRKDLRSLGITIEINFRICGLSPEKGFQATTRAGPSIAVA